MKYNNPDDIKVQKYWESGQEYALLKVGNVETLLGFKNSWIDLPKEDSEEVEKDSIHNLKSILIVDWLDNHVEGWREAVLNKKYDSRFFNLENKTNEEFSLENYFKFADLGKRLRSYVLEYAKEIKFNIKEVKLSFKFNYIDGFGEICGDYTTDYRNNDHPCILNVSWIKGGISLSNLQSIKDRFEEIIREFLDKEKHRELKFLELTEKVQKIDPMLRAVDSGSCFSVNYPNSKYNKELDINENYRKDNFDRIFTFTQTEYESEEKKTLTTIKRLLTRYKNENGIVFVSKS